MRKKLMAMLLCVAMLMTLLPTMAFAASVGGTLKEVTAPIYGTEMNSTEYVTGNVNFTTGAPTVSVAWKNGIFWNGSKPAGVTVSVTQPASKSGSYAVSLATDGTTPAGTYTFRVEAKRSVVTEETGAFTFVVDPKPVTVTGLAANNKTYDGTEAATFNVSGATLDGVLDKDKENVSVKSAAGTFEDANAATGKAVTLTQVVLDGDAANNYKVDMVNTDTTGFTADIAKADEVAITVSAVSGLVYNEKAQALVTSNGSGLKAGSLSYEVNGTDWSQVGVPTETAPGEYTVAWEYDQENENYNAPEEKSGSVTATIAWPEVGTTVFANGPSASITGETGRTDDPSDYDYTWEVVYDTNPNDPTELLENDVVSLGANTNSQIVGVSGLKEGRAILKETYTYNGWTSGQKPSYTKYYTVIVLPAVRNTITVKVGKTETLDGEGLSDGLVDSLSHVWEVVPESSEGAATLSSVPLAPHSCYVTGEEVGPVLVRHGFNRITGIISREPDEEWFLVNVVKGDGDAKIVKTTEELIYTGEALTLATVEENSNTGEVRFAVVPNGDSNPTSCSALEATEKNAGTYNVFYEVWESDNYNAKGVTYACTVTINPAKLTPPANKPDWVKDATTSNSAAFTVNSDDVGNNYPSTWQTAKHWTLQYSIDNGKSWYDVTDTTFTVKNLAMNTNYEILLRKHVRGDDTNHTDSEATDAVPFTTSDHCSVVFLDNTPNAEKLVVLNEPIDENATLSELPAGLPAGPASYYVEEEDEWRVFQNWYRSDDDTKEALTDETNVDGGFIAYPNMVPAVVYEKVTGFVGNGEYLIVSGDYAMNNATTDPGFMQPDYWGGTDVSDAICVEDSSENVVLLKGADANIVWEVTVDEDDALLKADDGYLYAIQVGASYYLGTRNDETTGTWSIKTAGAVGNALVYSSNDSHLCFNGSKFEAGMDTAACPITLYKNKEVGTCAPATVEAAEDLVYDGTDQVLVTVDNEVKAHCTMQYSLDGTTWTDEIPTGKDAGPYKVYVKAVGAAGYKNKVFEEPITVNIAKRPVVLDWGTTSFTYDGKEKTVTAVITNKVYGDGLELVYSNNAKTEVGEYTATVSLMGVSVDNYTLKDAEGNDVENLTCAWKINKRVSSGGGGGGGVSTYTITTGKGVTADKKSASSGTTVTLTVAEGYEDVVVKDKNGKAVDVTAAKDGKFTFKMPSSAVTVSVSKAEAPADAVCADFNDVDVDAWSHAGIHYCLEKGMMNGVADAQFAPGAATTRAMIVTMLARLSGYSVNGEGGQWYVPSMEWAVANGVSDGTNMTASITREQLATMLYRYAVEIAKVDVDKFTADTNTLSYEDVFTVSEWANAGVHFCLASGIIGGYEDGTIRPQANATRAEVAKMFMSFCENVLAK